MSRVNGELEALVAELVGQEVSRVVLAENSVGFLFGSRISNVANIYGSWKLFDAAGGVIDSDCSGYPRTRFNLWKVVGSSVVGSRISLEGAFNLQFDSGLRLECDAAIEGGAGWDLHITSMSIFIVNGEIVSRSAPQD